MSFILLNIIAKYLYIHLSIPISISNYISIYIWDSAADLLEEIYKGMKKKGTKQMKNFSMEKKEASVTCKNSINMLSESLKPGSSIF